MTGHNVTAAREFAAFFGGKALTGTKKQKPWGEKIRLDKLRSMAESQAAAVCDPTGICRNARFWIENRSRSAAEIAEFVFKQKQILAEYNAAINAGDRDRVADLANAYNSLTSQWGF